MKKKLTKSDQKTLRKKAQLLLNTPLISKQVVDSKKGTKEEKPVHFKKVISGEYLIQLQKEANTPNPEFCKDELIDPNRKYSIEFTNNYHEINHYRRMKKLFLNKGWDAVENYIREVKSNS